MEYSKDFVFTHDGYRSTKKGKRLFRHRLGRFILTDEGGGTMLVIVLLLCILMPVGYYAIDKSYFSSYSRDYPLKDTALVVSKDVIPATSNTGNKVQVAVQDRDNGNRYVLTLDSTTFWASLAIDDTVKLGFNSSGDVENIGFRNTNDCLGCQGNSWS